MLRGATRIVLLSCAVLTSALCGAETAHAQTAPSVTQVDASRGGVTISSGVNSLTIGARFQFRWIVEEREASDSDTLGSNAGSPDGIRGQFDVPRMRISLSGGAFRPWMKYLFQFDFSRTSGEGDSKIKDAVFEIRPPNRSFRFMMGQFKAPSVCNRSLLLDGCNLWIGRLPITNSVPGGTWVRCSVDRLPAKRWDTASAPLIVRASRCGN